MNITLRQRQTCCTVARLGSFTKAASALHTTQPALSVQVGQLEGALAHAAFYVVASNLLGLLTVWGGYALARLLWTN